MQVRSGVRLEVQGLAAGSYELQPYDTWQGVSLEALDVACATGDSCTIALPDFTSDMAFKIIRK
jgi:hypothetical protein